MTTTRRHKWVYPDEYDASDTRDKTCARCGIRAERFGIGSRSYWVFTSAAGATDTLGGRSTPPCEPGIDMEAPNPLNVKVIGSRSVDDSRPTRSLRCAHCGKGLEWLPGGDWTAANGPGLTGRDQHCYARSTDDGYGSHEPETPIVHPPADDQS